MFLDSLYGLVDVIIPLMRTRVKKLRITVWAHRCHFLNARMHVKKSGGKGPVDVIPLMFTRIRECIDNCTVLDELAITHA